MQITDLLAQVGGLGSIARELGISESEAARGAKALLPAILGGFKKQAQAQPSGVAGLGGLLGQLGGAALLDNVLSSQPADVSRGNDVLGQIFGSKDVSRTVAENAAQGSGLSSSLLEQMLPMLAMLVAGYLGRQESGPSSGGGLGDLSGGLTGGRAPGGETTGGGLLGGIASMLDLNRDGNPLDDILRMAGKLGR